MNHTNLDPAVFEQIVQEVIRRLLQRGVGVVDSNGSAAATGEATVLQLDDRLVTLATLRNRLAGVEQLVVQPRAIVTPAVLDELKDRNIELTRQTTNH